MTRVLVTGASGSIGATLCSGLPAVGYELRTLDLLPPERPAPGVDVVVGDLHDAAVLDRALDGVDAVVHLAALSSEAPLPDIVASHVMGTFAVLEACRRHGVRRVVNASSNHAVGYAPRVDRAAANLQPRPDTFYGVGKAAAEALCSLYADRYSLEVASLRIGSFLDRPTTRRHLSTWLSPGDCLRLVDACLTAPLLTHTIVWGVSANTRGWWDLEPGRRIGYLPQDDAENHAAVILSQPVSDEDRLAAAYVGGGFVGSRYDDGAAARQ